MKVKCLHGYFIFSETRVGQVSDFVRLTGLDISPVDDYFTFTDLEDAESFSIKNKPYLTSTATKTYAGKIWNVFEQNEFVYDFTTGLLVNILSIKNKFLLYQSNNKFIANGLILPGSLTDEGQRVKDYAAWFSRDTLNWTYSEVNYV